MIQSTLFFFFKFHILVVVVVVSLEWENYSLLGCSATESFRNFVDILEEHMSVFLKTLSQSHMRTSDFI
jgi:hypothetical protein